MEPKKVINDQVPIGAAGGIKMSWSSVASSLILGITSHQCLEILSKVWAAGLSPTQLVRLVK